MSVLSSSKILPLLIAGLLPAGYLLAQLPSLPRPVPKNEVGLMVDFNITNADTYLNSQGIVYTRHRNDLLSYRVTAGLGNFVSSGNTRYYYPTGPDSVISSRTTRSLNVVMLGAGLQVQRQFYQSVYLYAGADIRLGYGSTRVDTARGEYRKSLNLIGGTPEYGLYTTNSYSKYHHGFAGAAGIFTGVRLNIRRHWAAGLEFTNPILFSSGRWGDGPESGSSTDVDLDLVRIQQRVFVVYRF